MIKDFVVGQKVYGIPRGNWLRRFIPAGQQVKHVDEIYTPVLEGEVIAVGRKYITVRINGEECKFAEHSFMQGNIYAYNDGSCFCCLLFKDAESALEDLEREGLLQQIKQFFSHVNKSATLPVKTLREILRLINQSE